MLSMNYNRLLVIRDSLTYGGRPKPLRTYDQFAPGLT